MLFVEILFRVRTITFRSTSLFKMQNRHALTHIWLMSTFGEKVKRELLLEAARGSAIDIDFGSGQCHHLLGGQEDSDRRDLFGRGHMTTHSFCFALFLNFFKRDATQLCFLLHQTYYTRSASRARTDRIDQDIVGFESQSQAFTEITQSCVGGSTGQEGRRWFFSGTT